MVLHKRLEYGSSGYQVPPMPRVPSSARGKRSVRKKIVDDKKISAFDLLATVAGELLSQRDNSPPLNKVSETIKNEKQENEIPLKAEVFDEGSREESTLGSESVFRRQAGCALMDECKLELGIKTPTRVERRMNGNTMDENVAVTVEDPMDLDVKPPALVSSDSSVEVSISRNSLFPMIKNEMEPVVNRDDDENSSACTHPTTKSAKAFRPQRIGDRRVRKLLASKFWNAPQTAYKEGELSNSDAELKHIYRSRKMFYTRQRSQRSSFKRRKLFERCSISDTSTSLKYVGSKTGGSDMQATLSEANGASSSSGQKSSYKSGDYNVKFSIKSFKVPELFIEIPENATVGSLKRMVMEAVTAILSGGLRVGILLQGKKVRDDKQTLLQAGISRHDEVENLGFTLEPNSTQPPPPSLTCSEDPNSILSCASTEPIQRIQAVVPTIDQEPTQISALNGPESDQDSVHSHINDAHSSVDKVDNSKALVPVSGTMTEPLPAVPLRKSRRSEAAQRRIRRPFSVAEVEALVQAVEKLGTGRWRDVKIRSFDNAKHRTYVDLKDKWKTLVHTARISPQQRRGEPVPQELLDRVLLAQSYWSQQQSRLQLSLWGSNGGPVKSTFGSLEFLSRIC